MLLIKTKLCVQCGGEITSRFAKAFCSTMCREEHARAEREAAYRKLHTMNCLFCREEFLARNKSVRFCSGACRMNFEKASKEEPQPFTVECRYCGSPFSTANKKRYYCSVECRRAFDNENKRARRAREMNERGGLKNGHVFVGGTWGITTYAPWNDITEENVAGNVLDDSWASDPIMELPVLDCIQIAETSNFDTAVMYSDIIKHANNIPTRRIKESVMEDNDRIKELETAVFMFRNAFIKLQEAHRAEAEAMKYFADGVTAGEKVKLFNLNADEGII